MRLFLPLILLLSCALPVEGQQQVLLPFHAPVVEAFPPAVELPLILLPDTLTDRPPLDSNRHFEQMAAGVGGGRVGAAVLSGALLLPPLQSEHDDGWAQLMAVLIGSAVRYPLEATAGVYLRSNRGNQTGSLWATLAGAATGAVVGGSCPPEA